MNAFSKIFNDWHNNPESTTTTSKTMTVVIEWMSLPIKGGTRRFIGKLCSHLMKTRLFLIKREIQLSKSTASVAFWTKELDLWRNKMKNNKNSNDYGRKNCSTRLHRLSSAIHGNFIVPSYNELSGWNFSQRRRLLSETTAWRFCCGSSKAKSC